MAAGELNMGLGWIAWLAYCMPPVILVAIAAFARRWSRLKTLAALGAAVDLRNARFAEAHTRPRMRRAAVIASNDEVNLPRPATRITALAEPAVNARRPGLTARWKGEHRIAIHR